MGILKRITALAIGAAIMCTAVNTVFAENNNRGDTVNIKIDGSKANTSENLLYIGQGMISCQGFCLTIRRKIPKAITRYLNIFTAKTDLNLRTSRWKWAPMSILHRVLSLRR